MSLKAGGSSSSILVDSDSEEELSRKVVSHKRRLSDCLPDDRADEVGAPEGLGGGYTLLHPNC